MPLCVCVYDREREKQEHKLLCVFFCLGKKKKDDKAMWKMLSPWAWWFLVLTSEREVNSDRAPERPSWGK